MNHKMQKLNSIERNISFLHPKNSSLNVATGLCVQLIKANLFEFEEFDKHMPSVGISDGLQ